MKVLGTIAPLMLAFAMPLAAQQVVGHDPERSPYHDIRASQHVTLFGGYFKTQEDGLGILPKSAPTVGLKYDLPVAGPAEFFVRMQRVGSSRNSYDPTQVTNKSLGSVGSAILLGDIGFDFNLTGRKTWHSVIPVVGFGLGVATGQSSSSSSKDPYTFGTQFSFSGDFGLRIVPGDSYELRLMATPTYYQTRYPTQYFAAPSGGTALLSAGTARSGFRTAIDYTAGLAIPLFR